MLCYRPDGQINISEEVNYMHTLVKVLLALLWVVLLFAIATVGEQFIKMWLWKSHGICPVCAGHTEVKP